MISHYILLFLGLCQAVVLTSKNLQTFVSGFNVPNDLKKVKMIDKNWIESEKWYTIVNPEDGPFVHKETNQIFPIFSNYIGVKPKKMKWAAQRWSEHVKMNVHNGCYYDEETAAHASDTLARKLMEIGEQCHMLNFPDDRTEFYPKHSSQYFGVTYIRTLGKWLSYRRSKKNKIVYNGYYRDEERAAHASDTLARNLTRNGKRDHRLNFPHDDTEVYGQQTIDDNISITDEESDDTMDETTSNGEESEDDHRNERKRSDDYQNN